MNPKIKPKTKNKKQTFYFPDEVKEKLEKKAKVACGDYSGAVSRYLMKVADEELIFIDDNSKRALKLIYSETS